jgi:DNA invertase Pin-like site-specific DNA recombinase
MQDKNTAAVIYAAKSTEDEHNSISGQLADSRALCQREGWEVVGEYQDEAASAYRGNRGPGLEEAMRRCEELAPCALVVQHSSRFARGDGRQAKHLLHYALWAGEHDVTLASVEDPYAFTEGDIGFVLSSIAGMGNHQYSKRLATSVRNGMLRSFGEGNWHGRVPDGYRLVVERDDRGKITAREIVKDPDMAPTITRMFALTLDGHAPAVVARTLNAGGHRTARGGGWRARDLRRVLLNPFHAGLMVYGGAERKGSHPVYITPENQGLLAKRIASGSKPAGGGRPGRRAHHLLHRLAVCDRCGSRMYAETRSRVRKDGTKYRFYICANARDSTGLCSCKVNAAAVDADITRWLPKLLGDFDGWLREVLSGAERERVGLQRQLDEALVALDRVDRQAKRNEDNYVRALDGNESGDLFARTAERLTTQRKGAARRVAEQRLALDELEPQALADEMLDMVNRLRKPTVPEMNEALRAEFEEFRIAIDEDRDHVTITPVWRPSSRRVDLAAEYAKYRLEECALVGADSQP